MGRTEITLEGSERENVDLRRRLPPTELRWSFRTGKSTEALRKGANMLWVFDEKELGCQQFFFRGKSEPFKMDALRQSSLGYLIRLLSRNKLLRHPDDRYDNNAGNCVTQLGDDEAIIVDWYGADDPDNPHNWSVTRQYAIGSLIW